MVSLFVTIPPPFYPPTPPPPPSSSTSDSAAAAFAQHNQLLIPRSIFDFQVRSFRFRPRLLLSSIQILQ